MTFKNIASSISDIRNLLINEVVKQQDLYQIKRTLLYIESRLELADEQLTSKYVIDAVNSSLNQAIAQLNAYISSNNKGNFDAALDNLYESTKNIQGVAIVVDRANDAYLLSSLRENDERILQLQTNLEEIDKKYSDLKEVANKFIENIDSEIEELIDGKDGLNGRFTKAMERFEASFKKELYGDNEGNKGWAQQSNEKLEEINKILTDGKKIGRIIGVGEVSMKERANVQLSWMANIKNKCNDVLGLIGLGASVGGYQRNANTERNAAIFWTLMLLIVFVGIVCFNLDIKGKFYELNDRESLANFLIFRGVLSLPFIAFMWYVGVKAKNHRKMEIYYRQFELELAAFEPNLANLDKEILPYAKLEFMQRTFGQSINGIVDSKREDGVMNLDKLKKFVEDLKSSIKTLEDLIKRKEQNN